MNRKFLEKVPDWYKSNEDFELVLSNDLDGIVSTSVLSKVKKWKVNYFYDFTTLYITKETKLKNNKSASRVWADVAVLNNEKTFDNHVSRKDMNDKVNNLCINPNIINDVTNQNYLNKYCGSTALLIWSIYDLPLPKSELGKMLLLSIDCAFKGYYGYGMFPQTNQFYLCEMFGFYELYDVLKNHGKDEFLDLIKRYNLSEKIEIDHNGFLRTKLDLDFLSKELGIEISIPANTNFIEMGSLQKHAKKNYFGFVKDIKRLYSVAYVGRNNIMYSTY